MIKKSCLYLLLTLVAFDGFSKEAAPNNSDSLESVWTNAEIEDCERFAAIDLYYRSYTYAEPDEALKVTDYHFNLATEMKVDKELSKSLSEKSYVFYLKGETEKSLHYLEQSIETLERLDEPHELASMKANLGNLYLENNKYQEAVKVFSECLKIFKETDKKASEAAILNNLGNIFNEIESYDLALEYAINSKNIYENIEQKDNLGEVLLLIGYVLFNQGDYDNSLLQADEALSLLLAQNNQIAIAECYHLFALCYEKLGREDLALSFIDKSLETDKAVENKDKNYKRLIFRSNLKLESDLNGSTQKGEELLRDLDSSVNFELKADLYLLLSECYKEKGDYEKSVIMLENYLSCNDSLQKQKNKASIIRNAIQNDFDAKIYQNNLESQKEQADLKFNHLKKTYSIVLIAIAIIVFIIFYARFVISSGRKKRDQLLLELERLKNIDSTLVVEFKTFNLNKEKIETYLKRSLNETDWKVLTILIDDPVISNKEIAEKAFLSVPGISSSLRRMYDYFEIKDSKYKKISLLMEAIKHSNSLS